MQSSKTLIAILPLVCAVGWYELVYEQVPDPYLDEEFHIRQAQNYLDGKWEIWDPKITTPPGLYLTSWALSYGARALGFEDIVKGEGRDLRIINLLAALLLAKVVDSILERQKDNGDGAKKETSAETFERRHVLANILLFPVLFFFYGLYYTDVLSVLSVMTTYYFHLKSWNLFVILTGLLSLSIRQTNIFWVGLFLGALEAKKLLLRRLHFSSSASITEVLDKSGTDGAVYDPTVASASFEDYFKAALSYAVVLISNLSLFLRALWAYIVLFAVFLQFVVWNGGVALGDKANHIPTLHLAQMLYLWPYITFFSLPLVYPYFLQRIIPSKHLPAILQTRNSLKFQPRFSIAMPIVTLMLAIIHFNTIIHPFSLADNRHYVFYVLRYLNKYPATRYLVAPVYFLCAWAVIMPLSQNPDNKDTSDKVVEKTRETSASAITRARPGNGIDASWLLIWIGTTTLSLFTAPLIEPRYCILPWIMWRLQVHNSTSEVAGGDQETKDAPIGRFLLHNHRLWLETIWFLLINSITGYVFLYRGFDWKQEPGNIQRFMW